MGKLLRIIAVLSLLALLLRFLPHGSFRSTELCRDCGRVRATCGWWYVSGDWAWRTDEGKPEATPASLFLARVAPVAHPAHVWRAWRGKGAPAVLPQEEALARLAPPLADEAVRARLASPALDGGGLPVWFASRGWPPADAAEARSWWAAAKGAR